MSAVQPIPFRRVYVWQFPVRLFHLINALGIFLLIGTGYIIGNPQAIFSANEAYQQYWFGWMRFTHFASAYIVFFNFLFRAYWGFVGNRYARWSNFVPVNKVQLLDLWETIRIDILQLKLRGKISVGHNYLASLTYLCLFLIFLFQVITGFGLYASMSEAYLPHLFAWIVPLMGGDANVRHWHHLSLWAFVIFIIIHVYLVFYHDWVEGRGDISSIIGGWKFQKDEDLENH